MVDTPNMFANDRFEREKNPAVIVCAACKKGDVILAGARHFDMVMNSQLRAINKELRHFANAEQGFIDQYGTFYTREEALKIVKESGRPMRNPKAEKILFSEDLY